MLLFVSEAPPYPLLVEEVEEVDEVEEPRRAWLSDGCCLAPRSSFRSFFLMDLPCKPPDKPETLSESDSESVSAKLILFVLSGGGLNLDVLGCC